MPGKIVEGTKKNGNLNLRRDFCEATLMGEFNQYIESVKKFMKVLEACSPHVSLIF